MVESGYLLKVIYFYQFFLKLVKKKSLKKINQFNRNIIKKILSKLFKIKISIKLPNDLLIDRKKICGILQETIFFNEHKFLIVGIGINLVKNPFLSDYPTTNLYKLTKVKISVSNVSKKLILIYMNFLKSKKFF